MVAERGPSTPASCWAPHTVSPALVCIRDGGLRRPRPPPGRWRPGVPVFSSWGCRQQGGGPSGAALVVPRLPRARRPRRRARFTIWIPSGFAGQSRGPKPLHSRWPGNPVARRSGRRGRGTPGSGCPPGSTGGFGAARFHPGASANVSGGRSTSSLHPHVRPSTRC